MGKAYRKKHKMKSFSCYEIPPDKVNQLKLILIGPNSERAKKVLDEIHHPRKPVRSENYPNN
jgi:hypothetical protein